MNNLQKVFNLLCIILSEELLYVAAIALKSVFLKNKTCKSNLFLDPWAVE